MHWNIVFNNPEVLLLIKYNPRLFIFKFLMLNEFVPKIIGVFWILYLEIFHIHSLATERRPKAISACVIFYVAQGCHPIFCSRPLSSLTCLSLSHLAREGLSNPSNTDWNRLLSWWSTGIRPIFLQETL